MRRLVLVTCSLLSACGSSGGGTNQMDAPPLTGDKYSLHWGPVAVQPGMENTQCVTVKLSNTSDIKVHQMHNSLGTGSHHLIVYRDDLDTTETTTPVDCQPFTGALNPSGQIAPMMITQRADDPLTLPSGVAYTLKAGQMIRIEMHYINSTDAPIMAEATVDFFAADPSSIHDEANILFIGSPDVMIPAGQTVTLNEFFTPSRANLDLSSAKFFAITGHTHHYGTDMQVNLADSATSPKTSVYKPAPFEWAEPLTQVHSPEFTIPGGGGFDFTCTYHNTGATAVKFGESANDEMCFFWAYYYPSKGSHVCVHTTQFTGNLDICCPDAGPNICNRLM